MITRQFDRTLICIFLLIPMSLSSLKSAESNQTPIGTKWWPSEWGLGDQRGAANRMTPEKVLQAIQLIRVGKVYQLGRVYEEGMPLAGGRHFVMTIPGSPTSGPVGQNMMVSHDEMFSGEIGQVGTQMDGLGHVGVRLPDDDYFYNGFKRSEFSKSRGLEKLGVENIGVFFTRGVLIDVAGYKRVERLNPGYAITSKDIQETLKSEGVEISAGDMVAFRTGHGRLWMKDNSLYGSGGPGIGLEAAKWLIGKKVVMVGSDTWGMEVFPSENKDRPVEVHQWLITRNGIYTLENLDLEALATDKVYEFAFIFAPLKLKGASGSPGNPIAVQ